MKCLETRETREGYRRRRYETAAGLRFTTIEVPVEVWKRINSTGRPRDRAAQATRALERESLRRQAVALAASGLPRREVARRLNKPETTIRRWVNTNNQPKGKL